MSFFPLFLPAVAFQMREDLDGDMQGDMEGMEGQVGGNAYGFNAYGVGVASGSAAQPEGHVERHVEDQPEGYVETGTETYLELQKRNAKLEAELQRLRANAGTSPRTPGGDCLGPGWGDFEESEDEKSPIPGKKAGSPIPAKKAQSRIQPKSPSATDTTSSQSKHPRVPARKTSPKQSVLASSLTSSVASVSVKQGDLNDWSHGALVKEQKQKFLDSIPRRLRYPEKILHHRMI